MRCLMEQALSHAVDAICAGTLAAAGATGLDAFEDVGVSEDELA